MSDFPVTPRLKVKDTLPRPPPEVLEPEEEPRDNEREWREETLRALKLLSEGLQKLVYPDMFIEATHE